MAVSRDDVADSRAFAKGYGIRYPLLSDTAGALSRALVGIDEGDLSIPGVVILSRDGSVVFRQVAGGKDDRLTTEQVLAAADRTLGTRGPEAEKTLQPIDRAQLRFETGAGQIRIDDRWRATGGSRFTVHVPLARYLIAGLGLTSEYREAPLSLLGTVGVRLPIFHDIAAIQLSAETGLPISAPGVYAGVRLGMWFAWTPRWAVHVDGSFGANDAGAEDQLPAWSLTFGVSRLLDR